MQQSPLLTKTTQLFSQLSLSLPSNIQQQSQDPFIKQGGEIIYNQQHQFIIRMQQKPNQIQTLKNMQTLRVKILMNQLHGMCKNIKIQLTSDSELYFNFVFNCSDWQFKRIKQNQNMFIQFKEYPEIIVKNFIKLKNQKEQGKFLAVFTVFTEKQGKLDIIRKAEFKDDSILEFYFIKASEQQVKQSIQYRYDIMKKQYEVYTQRYQQITQTIKSKNPSLMMQIAKGMKKGK